MNRHTKSGLGVVVLIALSGLPFMLPSEIIAAAKSPKLAKCEGKKRPANPYGSVSPNVDPVRGTVAEPRGIHLFPPEQKRADPSSGNSKDEEVAPRIPPIGALRPVDDSPSC